MAWRRPDDRTVWLFDLDNTLHDAGAWVFGQMHQAMGAYTAQTLGLPLDEAQRLNRAYWQRYGATLLGLMRHHGVQARHFLQLTHDFPGLEERVTGHRHDLASLARLPGRRIVLTNAPRAYAERVLDALGVAGLFDGLIGIDDMHMFGRLRPKPDARMLRRLLQQLRVQPWHAVLVEDTLENLRAARRVGLNTVWLQRFLQRPPGPGMPPRRLSVQPAYVDRKLRRLGQLTRG